MWRIEFDTDRFLPYLPEECQQNPGAYGFELAQWLSQQLAMKGIATAYPVGEDWGWFIEYFEDQTEIMIGCNSEAKEGDGYKGKALHWRVFVRQSLSIKQRLKGGGSPAKMQEIADHIVAAFLSAGIAVKATEA